MGIEMRMDPETMSGQMVISGFEGKTLPGEVAEALGRGRLSGVVLFERNLGTPAEVRALTDSIRAAAAVPAIIAVDLEGGRVRRFKAPFTAWPAARALGRKDDPELARAVAEAMAAELLAVGINTNFGPVLDVDSNPANPVIGDRSLGPDPKRVGRLGAALIAGFEAAGLISCGKHFPGHGDTESDSHLALPVVDADRGTLEYRELVPFVEAIKARAPMIMAGHLQARALDKYYPATISRAILTDLLREEMGFGGVIITDDLEMKALADNMPIEDAAFGAARAGADLLLVGSGPGRAEAARRAIVAALETGALSEGELHLKVRRVIRIKDRCLLREPPARSALAEIVGRRQHRDLAQSLGPAP